MTTILQISDTHIVPKGALVSGRMDTADALARLVARISSIREQIGPIDALLVSGDLSDDGSAESYARFRSLIAPVDLPTYVIPGNHDARDPMRAAFAEDLPKTGPLNWSRSAIAYAERYAGTESGSNWAHPRTLAPGKLQLVRIHAVATPTIPATRQTPAASSAVFDA